MDQNIESMCNRLMLAVDVLMNVNADKQQRLEANQFCENFKEGSPFCVQCGLYLTSKQNSPVARNFGFQLIEHCIKYRWNNLTDSEKQFIRDNAMTILASGTNHLLQEQMYIKNAISKVIVEIVKRQWPRDWPTLLKELTDLCSAGDTQTELVMLILLRLTEDVVTFQNITPQRRRELYHVISFNVSDILGFIVGMLRHHSAKFIAFGNVEAVTDEQFLIHRHMAVSGLEVLTMFVEWVVLPNLWAQEGILQMLCVLLTSERLQLPACECLFQIISRKGKLEERLPLLNLFDNECMKAIFQAAGTAASSSTNEQTYIFLKRLCQCMVALGNQLCALWGGLPKVGQPNNFELYLGAIFEFTCHPNPVLNSFTFSLWSSFFRHELISQDQVLQSFISRLAEVIKIKLMTVTNTFRPDHPNFDHCSLDFDCDDDYVLFFSKYRNEISDALRLASMVRPLITFQLASSWVAEQIQKPIVTGCESSICNFSSPSYVEWNALSVFLEAITRKYQEMEKPTDSFVDDGVRLLESVLRFEVSDPLILSCNLSCVSALFIFVTASPQLLSPVLEKLFSAVTFTLPGQTKATRSRAVKNVRCHACSSLVKICKRYPNFILPSFNEIYIRVKTLSSDSDQLSQMEKCTLLEALILIANQFNQYSEQANFIDVSLAPVKAIWLSQEMNYAFSSSDALMEFIGLNQTPAHPGDDDVMGINRSQIIYCITTILGVMKRSKWPDDIELARERGFVRKFPGSQNAILCNPATHSILPFLDNLFKLIRSYNELWIPEKLQKVSPEYSRAYDMLDIDKQNTYGINPPPLDSSCLPIDKTPVERMQLFLSSVNDQCYHVLGNAGPSLGHEFYATPNLAQHVVSHVLNNVDCIPDYRLRSIIRSFMKPFVQFCPPEYYSSSLIPILVALCPYMFQRLNNKWIQLKIKYENSTSEEEDNKELLEDQVNRQLSREYIDLLSAIIHVKKGNVVDPTIDAMDEDEPSKSQQSDSNQTISELGELVFKNNIILSAIVSCCFRALSWNDTTICTKTLYVCSSLIKHLVSSQSISSTDSKDLLISILIGLQQHGQHEANQNFLLNVGYQAYVSLRTIHPDVKSVFLEIPDCPKNVLNDLDDIIMQMTPNKPPVSEKKKKEMFKKVVFNIIGQNVGQLFKRPVHIKSLPHRILSTKPPAPSILGNCSADGALCRLFASTDEDADQRR